MSFEERGIAEDSQSNAGPLAAAPQQHWRLAVVAEAMRWRSARFHLNAFVAYRMIDCGRLPWAVFTKIGIAVPDLPPHWPRDFACNAMAESEPYLNLVRQAFDEIESPGPGDLALFKPLHSRCFSHAAIVVRWPEVIHARGVGSHPQVEASRADKWPLAGSPVKFFTPRF